MEARIIKIQSTKFQIINLGKVMYLIINEDRSASVSSDLTKELMECAEAGVVEIYDVSCTPIKILNPNSEWEAVE
jgi:hypothetical protein